MQRQHEKRNLKQQPHYIAGLGDGNVHAPNDDATARGIWKRPGMPQSGPYVRTRNGGRTNDADVPWKRNERFRRERGDAAEGERDDDDEGLVVLRSPQDTSKGEFHGFGRGRHIDEYKLGHDRMNDIQQTDGPWQMSILALLCIIGILVALFLWLITDQQGPQTGAVPHYRRNRRRVSSATRTKKKKTDEWSEDEIPSDIDGAYRADSETSKHQRSGTTLYYPHDGPSIHVFPPQQQHRQRKPKVGGGSSSITSASKSVVGGSSALPSLSPTRRQPGVVIDSHPYYHRTSSRTMGAMGRIHEGAETSLTSVSDQPESLSLASNSPKHQSSPGAAGLVTGVSSPVQHQQAVSKFTKPAIAPGHSQQDQRSPSEAHGAHADDTGLGLGLEGFESEASQDRVTRMTNGASDSPVQQRTPTPSTPAPTIASAASDEIQAGSPLSSFASTASDNSSPIAASQRDGATLQQEANEMNVTPTTSTSSWSTEDEETGTFAARKQTEVKQSQSSTPTKTEDGSFAQGRRTLTPRAADAHAANLSSAFSPTGLKRRHGGIGEKTSSFSSLTLPPGHEDMPTPRTDHMSKTSRFRRYSQDRVISTAVNESSLPSDLVLPFPTNDTKGVDENRDSRETESPALVDGMQIPFVPLLDQHKSPLPVAPQSICLEELHLVRMVDGNMGEDNRTMWGTRPEEGDVPTEAVEMPPSPPVYRARPVEKSAEMNTSLESISFREPGLGCQNEQDRIGERSSGGTAQAESPEQADDPRNAIKHKRKDLTHCTDASSSLTSSIRFSELNLQDVIGGGGFGQVWRASWKGTPVAVKVLTGSAQKEHVPKSVLEEFAAEINMVSGMRHPNVCLYMGACLDPPNRAIVTELAANGSLWDALRQPLNPPYSAADGVTSTAWPLELYESVTKRPVAGLPSSHHLPAPPCPPAGTWPWILVKRVASGAARGMTYLHSGNPPVLHRDLKSANLLLDDSYTAKVADFGLSRLKAQNRSMTGNCGTVQWMAPEVLASQRYAEPADVFSYGIILWELLTRECPYEGMTPIQCALAVLNKDHRPEIPIWCPPSLTALIRACVEKDPHSRPTFTQIISALDAMP